MWTVWIYWVILCMLFLSCIPENMSWRRYLMDYGKTYGSTASNWLFVPKHWFTHFYLVGTAWSLWILLDYTRYLPVNYSLLTYISTHGTPAPTQTRLETIITLTLMTLHCSRRLYECVYVSKTQPEARMGISHYIIGFLFYFGAVLCLSAGGLASMSDNDYTSAQENPYRISLGILVFLLGNLGQHDAHCILAALRDKQPNSVQREAIYIKQSHYALPRTRSFKYILFPHYSFEMLLYVGLVLITSHSHPFSLTTWLSSGPMAILVWTCVILSISASNQRKWYNKMFKSHLMRYQVKNIIPFVY